MAGAIISFDRALAADQCTALTQDRQAAISPDDALAKLKAGNERFVSGNMRNCDLIEQVRATAGGQFPSSMVVGCIDARVPPELVFDQRIGDIFSSRLAGNIVTEDVVGGAEFATQISGAKLIVVLGHSECGAIKGAIDGVQLGELTKVLARIAPAIAANKDAPGEHTSKNKDFVQRVAVSNARLGAEALAASSALLRDRVAKNQLKIVAAMHDVATGRITFLN